jgi:membrane-bound lytic murein transglycosylase MltF
LAALLAVAVTQFSCSNTPAGEPATAVAAPAPAATARPEPAALPSVADSADDALPPLEYESELPPAVRTLLHQPFTGDLDAMVKRRVIRAGVTYNRTNYFVEQGVQRGSTYEHLKNFEDRLNAALKTGLMRVHVVFFPMPRDMMLRALAEGRIDLAEGQFTITPERQALVDFAAPFRRNVNEIVVSAPGTDAVSSTDDLSGREVFVRKSSSYYQSLLALNQRLQAKGRPPVVLLEAAENLEDDDLLEMVNAGLVKYIVVDDYLAQFWKQVFPALTLHTQATLRTGADLAPAIRKNSPVLARAIARYAEQWGPGSTFGNVIRARYLQSTRFVKSATAEAERRKFEALLSMFRTYSGKYDLDYLLMAAQGYQESRLDHAAKSRVGAIGVMQVMPATGAELKVGDIQQVEPNIHAGVKYIRQIINDYFQNEPMTPVNKVLFAFASYNAGPGRIRQLRRETARRGLDPNVWFGNVEQIVSARIGRETVDYVSNIFKYYVAYRLALNEQERRAAAKAGLSGPQK